MIKLLIKSILHFWESKRILFQLSYIFDENKTDESNVELCIPPTHTNVHAIINVICWIVIGTAIYILVCVIRGRKNSIYQGKIKAN